MKLYASLFGILLTTMSIGVKDLEAADAKAEKKHGKHKSILTLTDTFNTNGDNSGTNANISHDGRKIFAFYFDEIEADGLGISNPVPQAQLFENEEGKLELKHTVFNDLGPGSIANTGQATPDFEHFVLMDFNAANSSLRIRLFNEDLTAVLQTVFVPNALALSIPSFTSDGAFFSVILIDTTSGMVKPTATLNVFETATLQQVVFLPQTMQAGLTFAPPFNTFFASRHNPFFTIQTATGTEEFLAVGAAFTGDLSATNPPLFSQLQIFQFTRPTAATMGQGSLTLFSITQLPQYPFYISALEPRGKKIPSVATLSVGTGRADLPKEKTPFEVLQPSFLPFDGDELRVYQYDGTPGAEAKLMASQNVKMDTIINEFDPKGRGKIIGTTVANQPLGIFINPNNPPSGGFAFGDIDQMFHLRETTDKSQSKVAPHGIQEIDQMYPVGPTQGSSQMQFSRNGKWLIVADGKGVQNFSADPTKVFLGVTNELLLFRVRTQKEHQ